ncbi:MAG TPA: BON domain-containing protein [Burkholderiaceae bacterium]|jgi:osmotically-inducible protein OsmY|nr:BON domain-containing protein [Burkholderiaceae bacterium]
MKTDAQLQQDVIEELKWEQSVNAAQIGVEVSDGIVTLAGHVGSFAEKWDAERAARRVSGVNALAIEIDVTLPGSSQRNDVDIARSVENILDWNTYLPKDHINVTVEGGWITLSGEVDRWYQKQTLAAGVRYLMGVKGMSDNITIKPAASSNGVKLDIEAALMRRAKANGHNVSVEVHDASVTLSGTVGNWSEHEWARRTAWGTPGVRKVVDNITIAW